MQVEISLIGGKGDIDKVLAGGVVLQHELVEVTIRAAVDGEVVQRACRIGQDGRRAARVVGGGGIASVGSQAVIVAVPAQGISVLRTGDALYPDIIRPSGQTVQVDALAVLRGRARLDDRRAVGVDHVQGEIALTGGKGDVDEVLAGGVVLQHELVEIAIRAAVDGEVAQHARLFGQDGRRAARVVGAVSIVDVGIHSRGIQIGGRFLSAPGVACVAPAQGIAVLRAGDALHPDIVRPGGQAVQVDALALLRGRTRLDDRRAAGVDQVQGEITLTGGKGDIDEVLAGGLALQHELVEVAIRAAVDAETVPSACRIGQDGRRGPRVVGAVAIVSVGGQAVIVAAPAQGIGVLRTGDALHPDVIRPGGQAAQVDALAAVRGRPRLDDGRAAGVDQVQGEIPLTGGKGDIDEVLAGGVVLQHELVEIAIRTVMDGEAVQRARRIGQNGRRVA